MIEDLTLYFLWVNLLLLLFQSLIKLWKAFSQLFPKGHDNLFGVKRLRKKHQGLAINLEQLRKLWADYKLPILPDSNLLRIAQSISSGLKVPIPMILFRIKGSIDHSTINKLDRWIDASGWTSLGQSLRDDPGEIDEALKQEFDVR